MLYVLADHNASVVGLADALGRLVAQYSYTPYGDLLAAELFTPGPDSLASESREAARTSRLGHQGLWTERFDRPWDGAMDLASADAGQTGPYRALCHNRNRVYDPAEGRFIENDPNGLGLPVLGEMVFGGRAIDAGDVAPDVQRHYGDGMNGHVAYGCRPRGARDPAGLFISPTDVLGAAVMGVVRGLRGGLESLISEYASNMEHDLDWAIDWGSPDHWHTRGENSWVQQAWDEGVRGGLNEWLNEDVRGLYDPLGFTPELVQAGTVRQATAQAARLGLRPIRGVARYLRVPLHALRDVDIAKTFKQLGYKVHPHFVDRLRGVASGVRFPADPGRMAGMGIRRLEDVLEVLQTGQRTALRDGWTVIRHGATEIILEGDMLRTIKNY